MSVYFPDKNFSPAVPSDDSIIWRYVDFTQLLSILETRRLWFSATSNFVDKWEGGLTAEQINRISENLPSFIPNSTDSVKQLYDALRATTYVSCWHCRDEETAAMWELYNDRGKEVAIKSTVGALRGSIGSVDNMCLGSVEYKEYLECGNIFPVTRNSPFFHKRLSFQHEQEFRIVKSEFNLPERASLKHGLRELVAKRGGPGRSVPVDQSTLIDEVVISPVVGKWMRTLVEEVLSTYELDDIPVSDSKLSDDPFK